MSLRDEEIIEKLMEEDEDFKNLVLEHRDLDRKIQDLDSKPYLIPAEEAERKKLSRLKLAKKDQILQRVAQYRREVLGE
ncbi:MAG: DUF465 domain-containing protein [Deltaproteobacteria bacterium]|nr:MAG: DUF465 domain-containing protein [Deltaproteobacteria bacterium]